MATEELKLNPQWEHLLPPHSPEELDELEKSCVKEGIREAICTSPDKFILDGRNRYVFAKRHNLSFQVRVISYKEEWEYIEWILRNQLGRRNLAPEQASYLRGKLYQSQKGQHGGRERFASSQLPDASCQSGNLEKTAEKVAKETGVSTRTILRDDKRATLIDSLPANVRDSITSGALKPSDKELKQLSKLAPSDVQEVCREVRVGQKSMADALAGRKPAAPAEAEPEKPKTLADHLRPMIHSLDKMRQRTDQLTDEFGPSPFAKSWLKYSDLAVIELKKWARAS